MSQEDELAKAKVELYDEVRLEVPYNHYGTRGVVDVVGIDDFKRRWISAIELKSESAVRQATGANEIIRQFKRQIEYFKTRDDINSRTDLIDHFLEFQLTRYTFDHVKDNLVLYQSVISEAGNAKVLLQHELADGPLLVLPEGLVYQVGSEAALEAEGIDKSELMFVGDL